MVFTTIGLDQDEQIHCEIGFQSDYEDFLESSVRMLYFAQFPRDFDYTDENNWDALAFIEEDHNYRLRQKYKLSVMLFSHVLYCIENIRRKETFQQRFDAINSKDWLMKYLKEFIKDFTKKNKFNGTDVSEDHLRDYKKMLEYAKANFNEEEKINWKKIARSVAKEFYRHIVSDSWELESERLYKRFCKLLKDHNISKENLQIIDHFLSTYRS